ncbi:MAG: ABC transporter permease, partial [Actinobacteria bacterium]|nr:ABC transporter permease [Actinomycetota bacterium]
MDGSTIVIGLAGVLTASAPIVVAAIGETLAERAGVINLSVNGTILLSAMGSFVVAVTTDSLILGFFAGMIVGGAVSLVVAFGSISLRQSQVAVGFVLALFCRDLSYFLGNPFMGDKGPRLTVWAIPFLKNLPVVGTMFFRQDIMTYFSFVLIFAAWWWIFRTRQGLVLRAVGDRPAAAFARGTPVNLMRYVYTGLGGAMVGPRRIE